ncbi:MAG TPA: hypothetical protein VJZ75_06440 [Candidatus Bathyarchaeia archaeon]|nr:hypothetical protein [Candidatus Bathyarchaeia archaeon]
MDSKKTKLLTVVFVLVAAIASVSITLISLGPTTTHSESVHITMTTFNWGFNVTTIPNFQDGKIYYDNPTITVHFGQRVIIDLRSLDITHGFAIDALNIQVFIPPGRTVTVDFVANQMGNFTYYCNTFCGIGHPYMHGILQVLA